MTLTLLALLGGVGVLLLPLFCRVYLLWSDPDHARHD
jgi:hypothetical protein